MNLGDLADMGEAIGGFAVVVSLLYLAMQLFNAANRAHHLHQENLLSDWMREEHAHGVVALLENPGVKQWWEVNHHWFTVGFRETARPPS